MTNPFDSDNAMFVVLVNDERQYCLWPESRAVPAGWQVVGQRGSRENCLKWIDEHWVDMRPLSLIRHMESKREALK
jgi:uncharacterized protein YbdZ (MbtH family)